MVKLDDEAFMICDTIAFVFKEPKKLVAINRKNKQQKIEFILNNNNFVMTCGNMSESNTYKTMYIIEKNKERLLKGITQWDVI